MRGVKEPSDTEQVGNIKLREDKSEVWQVGGEYGGLIKEEYGDHNVLYELCTLNYAYILWHRAIL